MERGIATVATIADHVIPHNGNWDAFIYGDLQSLCKTHHDGSKKEIELKGYCSDVDLTGWPLDKKHPANAGIIAFRSAHVNTGDPLSHEEIMRRLKSYIV